MVEERLKSSSVIEDIQDLYDYVHFQYLPQIRDMSISEGERTAQRRPGAGKPVYERTRAGKVYKLVKAFGISAEQFALNFQLGKKREFAEDPGRLPLDMADECTEYPDFPTGETAMLAAKKMFAEEMFMNPRMRLAMRPRWFTRALIHVNVTEKGVKLIDEYHQFYEFKYLRNQSLSAITGNSARYLRMLKAECGLIEIVYELEGYNHLIKDLYDYVASDNYSEVAEAWNRDRKDVFDMVMDKFKACFRYT
jgi:transcription elongation factor SPT6